MFKAFVIAMLVSSAAALAPVRSAVVKTATAAPVALPTAPYFAAAAARTRVPKPAAMPVVLASQPAGAATVIFGVPIGLVLTGFPLIIAASVALLVIGPGMIQQFKRVLSGEGEKYTSNEN